MAQDREDYVWADFQKLNDQGDLVLAGVGSSRDLERLKAMGRLAGSHAVRFYSEDEDDDGNQVILVADGFLQQNSTGEWTGRFKAQSFRHEPPQS
jgi:hypothetical protein